MAKKFRVHINKHVIELTFGQGGSKWLIIRAVIGYITSSVAALFFKMALNETNIIDDNSIKFDNIAFSL